DLRLYSAALPTNLLAAVMASSLPTLVLPPIPLDAQVPESSLELDHTATSESPLALANLPPIDPDPAAAPRLSLAYDAASGQLLLQQELDQNTGATSWIWEVSDDLTAWSQAPAPTLTTSPSGKTVLQLLLPSSTKTTRFFRARSR
ncbi:MAG: hypothetical protein JNK85_13135, partial [Verrucomicrobiales bacterium]|nr:hypothetical protein [Verrucomicrobiales bacterium]